MIKAKKSIAQGDVLFVKVSRKSLPADAVEVPRAGALIVAHSETGHHHVIDELTSRHFEVKGSPLVCYLQLGDGIAELGGADVVHHRPWDTHETVRLLGKPGDVWKVHRQRESSPSGWVRVQD
jgi:hypothetical protein